MNKFISIILLIWLQGCGGNKTCKALENISDVQKIACTSRMTDCINPGCSGNPGNCKFDADGWTKFINEKACSKQETQATCIEQTRNNEVVCEWID